MNKYLDEVTKFASEVSAGDENLRLAVLLVLLDTYRSKGELLESFSAFQIEQHKKAEVIKQ